MAITSGSYTIHPDGGPTYNYQTVAGFIADISTLTGAITGTVVGDVDEAANIQLDGFGTTASNTFKLTSSGSGRHSGIWDGSAYTNIPASGSFCFYMRDPFVEIDGLQCDSTSVTGGYNIRQSVGATSGNIWTVSNCILMDDGGMHAISANAVSGTSTTSYIFNNIIYDHGSRSIHINDSDVTAYIYHNMVYDGSSYGIYEQASANTYCKNNVCYSHTNGNYVGTFASTDYNWSDDTTPSSGTGNLTSQSDFTTQFPGYADSPKDFLLRAAGDAGTDVTGDIADTATSIEGNSRTNFEMGASEYVAPGGGPTVPRLWHLYQLIRSA